MTCLWEASSVSATKNDCSFRDGEPKCVEWCPEEALDFTTSEALAQKARISSVKKLFQKALIATN